MGTIKNVYISGLGAVGCTYASFLYENASISLKVVANAERINRYSKSGIRINRKPFSFDYITPDSADSPADLIIIAVKHHQLEQSLKDIENFVGSNTTILSLLNGIISEEIIAEKFPQNKILYSFCVGIDAVREKNNSSFSKPGKIIFGEKNNKNYSQEVLAVKELFDNSNIAYSIPEDMIRELWWKFMINVGINQPSAILRAPYGVFQKIKEAQDLMKATFKEVIALAQKLGINLIENDIDEFIKLLNTLSPEGKTSMLQDIEARRKTEVEIFAGSVLELGRKHGVFTPINEMLFNMIRTLEQKPK